MKYRNIKVKIEISGEMFKNPLDQGRNSHTGFKLNMDDRWFRQPAQRMEEEVNVLEVLDRMKTSSDYSTQPEILTQLEIEELKRELDELLDRGDKNIESTNQ